MNSVLVIGSVNKDLCLVLDRQPKIGETKQAKSYEMRIGGKGFNQAIAVAQTSVKTGFLGAIHSSDQFQIRTLLDKYGIDSSQLIVQDDIQTGIAIVSLIDGDNSIVIASGSNSIVDAGAIECKQDYIGSFDYILIQNEVDPTVLIKLIELKSMYNYKIIFNPAPYIDHEQLDYSKFDLVTPNYTEYQLMKVAGIELDESQLLITLGSEGVQYQNTIYPAQKVMAIDTTGAGDCFNGYLTGLLAQEYSLEDAIALAQLAAAKSVQKHGAHEGIEPLEKIKETYERV